MATGLSAVPTQAATAESQSLLGIDILDPLKPITEPLEPVTDPVLGTIEPLVDPILGLVAPVPGIDGIGSIDGPGTYSCVTTTDPATAYQCLPIPLDLLGSTTDTVLTAVPTSGSGYEFGQWLNCPAAAGPVCTIPAGDLLGTLFTPIAEFVPVPGLPGEEEPQAPETSITAGPSGQTAETTATFGFKAEPAEGATFQCKLEGPSKAHGFEPCTTGKSYPDLEPGDYTFTVKAEAGDLEDATPAARSWTVTEDDEADFTAPNTYVSHGPKNKAWVLNNFTTYSLSSNEADVAYTYRLNGKRAVKCYMTECNVLNLRLGTNAIKFAASDASDNVDRSPVTRYVSVPRNNLNLRHSNGWLKRKASGHFFKTYSETSSRGATLSTKAKNIKKVALVVTKGKGYGKVKVMLGKKVLKRVDLGAKKTKKRQIVPVKTFKAKKKGTIKVVVISSNKTVRIEGLGIASR